MNKDSKENTSLGVFTSSIVRWLDPYKDPPPSGKTLLLTWDNIQTEGTWGKDGHLMYAAWAPKPSRPDWLKKRMWAKYKKEFIPTKVGDRK